VRDGLRLHAALFKIRPRPWPGIPWFRLFVRERGSLEVGNVGPAGGLLCLRLRLRCKQGTPVARRGDASRAVLNSFVQVIRRLRLRCKQGTPVARRGDASRAVLNSFVQEPAYCYTYVCARDASLLLLCPPTHPPPLAPCTCVLWLLSSGTLDTCERCNSLRVSVATCTHASTCSGQFRNPSSAVWQHRVQSPCSLVTRHPSRPRSASPTDNRQAKLHDLVCL